MQSIQEIAAEIVAREGGYVNDPADPGGATKYGVTIHTMRRLGLDLAGNGRVNAADVRRLTRAQAVDHNLDCIEIGRALGSKALTVWIGDGSNFPGQSNFTRQFERYLDAMRDIYKALPDDCFASVVIGPTHDLARNAFSNVSHREALSCSMMQQDREKDTWRDAGGKPGETSSSSSKARAPKAC